MIRELTRCFECGGDVPVEDWDDHECPTDELPGYDPAEPWMETNDF